MHDSIQSKSCHAYLKMSGARRRSSSSRMALSTCGHRLNTLYRANAMFMLVLKPQTKSNRKLLLKMTPIYWRKRWALYPIKRTGNIHDKNPYLKEIPHLVFSPGKPWGEWTAASTPKSLASCRVSRCGPSTTTSTRVSPDPATSPRFFKSLRETREGGLFLPLLYSTSFL